MTYAEVVAELAMVDAAITKALEAQSYGIAGRSVSRVTYAELIKRKNDLQIMKKRMTAEADGGGSVTYPYFGNDK